jgi:hypothetical protein
VYSSTKLGSRFWADIAPRFPAIETDLRTRAFPKARRLIWINYAWAFAGSAAPDHCVIDEIAIGDYAGLAETIRARAGISGSSMPSQRR